MRAAGEESESDSDDLMAFNGLDYEHENKYELGIQKMPSCGFQSTHRLDVREAMERKTPMKTLEMCQNFEDFRIAAMNGNIEMINKFIVDGFDVNESLKGGWTALLYSCSGGFHRVVRVLIDHGADPNKGKDSFTPLMAACASPKSDDDILICVRHLLEVGAEVNVNEIHNMTPLMFAAKTGKREVVKLLIQQGADVNAKDSQGMQSLGWASSFGHGSVIKILIENGADPKNIANSGESVEEVAANKGYKQIAEVLHKLQDCKEMPGNDDQPLLNFLPKNEVSKLTPETSQKIQKYGELEMFLVGLQLSELISLFHEKQISFQTLLTLTDEELIKLGINKLGARTQILNAIRDVHTKEWSNTSLPPVRDKKHISCPEAYAIVGNISKHLSFVQSTMTYLHKQSKLNPQDLEKGKNDVTVFMLIQEIDSANQSLNRLQSEMYRYQEYLTKVSKQVESIPVGVIGNQRPIDSRGFVTLAPYCFLTVTLLGAFYLTSQVTKCFHFPFSFFTRS